MRRAIAVLLLTVNLACQAESVVGEIRDGGVHHETTVEAWVHAQDPHGKHAHDAALSAGPDAPDEMGSLRAHEHHQAIASADHEPSGERAGQHEHGTCADHCTHVHGAALTCSGISFAVIVNQVSFDFVPPPPPLEMSKRTHAPPPRA